MADLSNPLIRLAVVVILLKEKTMMMKAKVRIVSVVLVLTIFGVSADADMAALGPCPGGVNPTELADLSSFSETGNFTSYFKNSWGHFSDFHFTIHIPGDEGIPSTLSTLQCRV